MAAMACVTLFILINGGYVTDSLMLFKAGKPYVPLSVVLFIFFLGFFSSLLLIIGEMMDRSSFLLPWLVLHILLCFILIVGGVSIFLHFMVNRKQYQEAALSIGIILVGVIVLLTWLHIYKHLFHLRMQQQKQRKMGISNLSNTYFHFQPEFQDIYSLPVCGKTKGRNLKEFQKKLSAHAYSGVFQCHELTSPNSIAVVRTNNNKSSLPVYFYGDPMGLLTWNNRTRAFETLEASIVFDTEEDVATNPCDEENEKISLKSTLKEDKDEESLKYAEIFESTSDVPNMNLLKDKRRGYTKDEIVNIYCNLAEISS